MSSVMSTCAVQTGEPGQKLSPVQLQSVVDGLVERALFKGSNDNITIIIVFIGV